MNFFFVILTSLSTYFPLISQTIDNIGIIDSVYSINLNHINSFDSININIKRNEFVLKGVEYQKHLDSIIFKNWKSDSSYIGVDSNFLFYFKNEYSDNLITYIKTDFVNDYKIILYENVFSYHFVTINKSFQVIDFITWSESTPPIYNIKNGNSTNNCIESHFEQYVITQKYYYIKEFQKTGKKVKKLFKSKKFKLDKKGYFSQIG